MDGDVVTVTFVLFDTMGRSRVQEILKVLDELADTPVEDQ